MPKNITYDSLLFQIKKLNDSTNLFLTLYFVLNFSCTLNFSLKLKQIIQNTVLKLFILC